MAGTAGHGRFLFLQPAFPAPFLYALYEQAENPQEADGARDAEQAEESQDTHPQYRNGRIVGDQLTQLLFHLLTSLTFFASTGFVPFPLIILKNRLLCKWG